MDGNAISTMQGRGKSPTSFGGPSYRLELQLYELQIEGRGIYAVEV